jgi:YVTN family beta-propeller protein
MFGACVTAALLALAFAPGADARMAYVARVNANSLVPVDLATKTPGTPIPTGTGPVAVALTPDGRTAYVVSSSSNDVTVIDTGTGTVVTTIELIGERADTVAVSPDGKTAYVGHPASHTPPVGWITPIDTQTNTARLQIPSPVAPTSIAVSPDGKSIWVADIASLAVVSIDPNTQDVLSEIPVADPGLVSIAITPDGKKAYATNLVKHYVLPLDLTTRTAGSPISVGTSPISVAITRDGRAAYVVNRDSDNVSVIDTATDKVTHTIPVGSHPSGIAITPDNKTAYVQNVGSGSLTPIDVATNQPGTPINLGAGSTSNAAKQGVAITPIQAPAPKLSAPATAEVGELVTFDASATVSEAPIKSYRYDFGDGAVADATGPTRRYAYSEPGTYHAKVTVDDGLGCTAYFPGLATPFTGQTAYCSGASVETSAPIAIEVREAAHQPPPPYLRLSVAAKRRQSLARGPRARVRCAKVACAVTAKGWLEVDGRGERTRRFRLGRARRSLDAGERATLSPAVPAAARRAARRALSSRGRAWAVIRVAARGEGAQRREAVRVVRLVR